MVSLRAQKLIQASNPGWRNSARIAHYYANAPDSEWIVGYSEVGGNGEC